MDFPEDVKLEAKRRGNYCCVICQQVVFLEVHHIIPEAEGGPATLDNAAPLCPSHHTLYGDNPAMRKFVRQVRDYWWDYCAQRATQPDMIALGQRFATMQAKIEAGIAQVSELKAVVTDQHRAMLDAIRSARTVQEVIQASTGVRTSTIQIKATGFIAPPSRDSTGSTGS